MSGLSRECRRDVPGGGRRAGAAPETWRLGEGARLTRRRHLRISRIASVADTGLSALDPDDERQQRSALGLVLLAVTMVVDYAASAVSGMAADTIGLLDALELNRAHIVGASMGGLIAQTIAIEPSDRRDRAFLPQRSTLPTSPYATARACDRSHIHLSCGQCG